MNNNNTNYKVQSILIPKDSFSKSQAIQWIQSNNFKLKKLDDLNNFYRFRQYSPQYLKNKGFSEYRTKILPNKIHLLLIYKPEDVGGNLNIPTSKKFNMLELFKGTGSVGEIFKNDFNIISLDFDPIYTPDIETDILKWNYKKFYNETNFIPNFIWASPPCNTFSPLAYPLKERDPKTAEPKSERALIGTKIARKTVEIINFFKKINPNLIYIIENPKGMLRNDKIYKKLSIHTTLYCLYNDCRYKPTDFWSNIDLDLKEPIKKNCYQEDKKKCNIVNLPLSDRYKIPKKLLEYMKTKVIFYLNKPKDIGAGILDLLPSRKSGEYPPHIERFLTQYGPDFIKSITICRDPVNSLVQKLLNIVSLGSFNKALEKLNYDKVFHLYAIITTSRVSFRLEKNEQLTINNKINKDSDTECVNVPLNQMISVRQLLNKTKEYMGPYNFTTYDPKTLNCQNFISSLLKANKLGNEEIQKFIIQDSKSIFENMPEYVEKISRFFTDTAQRLDVLREGGANPLNKNKQNQKIKFII